VEELTEESILLNVKEGNLLSMTELFERNHVKLYNFFLKLTFDRTATTDVIIPQKTANPLPFKYAHDMILTDNRYFRRNEAKGGNEYAIVAPANKIATIYYKKGSIINERINGLKKVISRVI